MHHTIFSLWCHFQQCPWDLGSVPAKKGRIGGGGWVHRMAASGIGYIKPLVGTGWAISSSFARMGLEMVFLSSRASISGSEAYFSLCRWHYLAMSHEYLKLIRKWAWFQLWIYTGWLQWHLCEVRSFKTNLHKWKYGTLKGSIVLKRLP